MPALAYRALTPLYDTVVSLTSRETLFKNALLDQACLQADWRVLDVACGTGTLALLAMQREPSLEMIGIDGDPEILKIARAKAARAHVRIEFRQALCSELPFEDASFDCVLSSLFLHHLGPQAKTASLREMERVLRPGASVHIADWGAASNPVSRALFYSIQLLDGFENTADHVAGRLPDFFARAGLQNATVRDDIETIFGTLSLFSARKRGG